MAERNIDMRGRRDRSLINILWSLAAIAVLTGAVMRMLATLLERADLRLYGVIVLAAGIGVALLAWAAERMAASKRDRKII